MKNLMLKFGVIILTMAIVSSCMPRVELDLGHWGDHAYIDNVQLFGLNVNDSAHLAEWYMHGESVAGVRQIIISQDNAAVDSSKFTATVRLKAGNSLDNAGLLFYFHGTKITPLNGAPQPGIISDLTKSTTFTYRLYSADGTYHDWKVNIIQ